MGSLVRRKRSFLMIAVAAFVLFGLLSHPSWAGSSVDSRKIQLLELLGLDGADPAVAKAAQQAHALFAVDVVPGEDGVSVILQLSGLPDYDSYLYKEDNRMVVDLRNTINLSPSPVHSLREEDPFTKVRNSQYRVSPSLISRIVLEMNDQRMPVISNDGKNIIITAPLASGNTTTIAGAVANPDANAALDEVVAVPAVTVNTAAPKMEALIARAEEILIPAKAMVSPKAAFAETIEQETEAQPVADAPEAQPTDEIAELLAASATAEEAVAESGEPAEPVEELIEAEVAEAELVEEAVLEEPVQEPAEETAVVEVVTEENSFVEVTVAPKEQMVEVPVEKAMEPKLVKLEQQPAAPAPALAAASAAQADEVTKKNNLVTLSFRNADLGAVLDILARKGDLNILAGKDVRGTVTVRLVDVPFDVALNAVLNVNGYGYIQTDNIIRVLPLSQLGSPVETRTETFMLSYAEATKVKATLQGLLTTNGRIETDARTNMIILTDVPANVERVRQLIPQIDRRVQQVLIEVLILDSVLRDAADLGITWNLSDTDDNSPGSLGADSIAVDLPKTVGGLAVNVGTLIDSLKLNVLVRALVENTESRILANPKILTIDNEAASIEIVAEFPYSDVTQTSAGGQLSNITFKEIGTKLEVKPQITHDDHVILWITPEQNSIAGETITGVPIVDTRRAETTLIVRNHQTIVLGGLRENRKVKSLNKVPFLGDLPGVKYAFRNVGSDDRDTELLVFLTVHIVESPPLLARQEIKFEELANMPRKPSASIDIIR